MDDEGSQAAGFLRKLTEVTMQREAAGLNLHQLLAARMDTRMAELAQRVIELAEQIRPEATGVTTNRSAANLTVEVKLHAAARVRQAQTIQVTVGDASKPIPARTSPVTAQRMLYVLIALLAILVLRESTELSAHDQSVLMNAIAIGGAALAVSDHIKVKPPDKKD